MKMKMKHIMFGCDVEYTFDLSAVVCSEVSNFLPSQPSMAERKKKHFRMYIYGPIIECV